MSRLNPKLIEKSLQAQIRPRKRGVKVKQTRFRGSLLKPLRLCPTHSAAFVSGRGEFLWLYSRGITEALSISISVCCSKAASISAR
jgi:hypothetical protein